MFRIKMTDEQREIVNKQFESKFKCICGKLSQSVRRGILAQPISSHSINIPERGNIQMLEICDDCYADIATVIDACRKKYKKSPSSEGKS